MNDQHRCSVTVNGGNYEYDVEVVLAIEYGRLVIIELCVRKAKNANGDSPPVEQSFRSLRITDIWRAIKEQMLALPPLLSGTDEEERLVASADAYRIAEWCREGNPQIGGILDLAAEWTGCKKETLRKRIKKARDAGLLGHPEKFGVAGCSSPVRPPRPNGPGQRAKWRRDAK